MQEIGIDEKLRYIKQPKKILDHKIMKLRNKKVVLVKVQRRHHKGFYMTWEPEVEIKEKYPYLFLFKLRVDFGDEIF